MNTRKSSVKFSSVIVNIKCGIKVNRRFARGVCTIRKYSGKIGFQVHTRTTKLVQHTPEKHSQLTDCRKRDLKFGYKGLTF